MGSLGSLGPCLYQLGNPGLAWLPPGCDAPRPAAAARAARYSSEWEKTVRRIGRWIDFEQGYKTLDPTFMESVWWVFSELHKKGLVYRGFKARAGRTRCRGARVHACRRICRLAGATGARAACCPEVSSLSGGPRGRRSCRTPRAAARRCPISRRGSTTRTCPTPPSWRAPAARCAVARQVPSQHADRLGRPTEREAPTWWSAGVRRWRSSWSTTRTMRR